MCGRPLLIVEVNHIRWLRVNVFVCVWVCVCATDDSTIHTMNHNMIKYYMAWVFFLLVSLVSLFCTRHSAYGNSAIKSDIFWRTRRLVSENRFDDNTDERHHSLKLTIKTRRMFAIRSSRRSNFLVQTFLSSVQCCNWISRHYSLNDNDSSPFIRVSSHLWRVCVFCVCTIFSLSFSCKRKYRVKSFVDCINTINCLPQHAATVHMNFSDRHCTQFPRTCWLTDWKATIEMKPI